MTVPVHLRALCGVCGQPVDATTVSAHMDSHGLLLPQDWSLAAWPDGEQVLLPPKTEGAS